MEFEAEQLLSLLNQGQEPPADAIDSLIALLRQNLTRNCLSADETYAYIAVLCKLQNSEHQDLLDAYVASEDPLLVSLILESVCLEWYKAEHYAELLYRFIRGCSWDYEQDAQVTALKISGEVLALGLHRRYLLTACYEIFAEDRNPQWVRLAAYRSLLRAGGVEHRDLPSEFARLSFAADSIDIKWQLIADLKAEIAHVSTDSRQLDNF